MPYITSVNKKYYVRRWLASLDCEATFEFESSCVTLSFYFFFLPLSGGLLWIIGKLACNFNGELTAYNDNVLKCTQNTTCRVNLCHFSSLCMNMYIDNKFVYCKCN